MNFLKTVDFEMTQPQYEQWATYIKGEWGGMLISTQIFPPNSPVVNPYEKKRYTTTISEHWKRNAPQELIDLEVKA
jgi:hypothetical protein